MNIIYGMNICSLNFLDSEIAFIIVSLCLQSTNASYKSIDLKKKKVSHHNHKYVSTRKLELLFDNYVQFYPS